MNITYTQNGDYFIPNIIIRKTKPLGHYGRLRKAYLEMHRPMKEIKIELLGIAIILLGIVLRANSFFEYFLGVFGFGIVVSGCFLKDKYK